MAKTFLTAVDLAGNELLNVRLQNLATAPAATEGRIYYDTVLKKVRFYDGTSWVDAGGSSLSTEALQDIVGAMVGTQTGITVAYDDVAGTLTFAVPAASETVVGSVELATAAETTTGTDNTRAVHPAGLKVELDKKAAVNHTQTSSTITDLAAVVKAYRLDEFAAPTASVPLNNQKITGLGTPTSATDAATKAYVDATAQGLEVKASVRVASTANVASITGLLVVDGVTTVAGDRVLLKNQTTASQNGIYVAAAAAWARSADADAAGELTGGTFVFVEEGSTQSDTGWVITTNGAITPGTTAHVWTQFSGAGAYVAGAGLTQSGTTFDVGAGTGITVAADSVGVDTAVVARKFGALIGDGAATSFVVTHSLNTRDVMVQVYLNSGTYEEVEVDIERTSVNTVTVRFATAPAASAYRVAVVG
jgi:hypothetical protein